MSYDYPPKPISPKGEALSIRNQLRLRWNTEYGCHEVYTTIHGTGVFRWFKISETLKDWYVKHFNLQVETYISVTSTGAITHYKPTVS
jgi:hypothetical protein